MTIENPWLLFPQCGVDGFYSNVMQLVAMVAALLELKAAGLSFNLGLPQFWFWEHEGGRIVRTTGPVEFDAVWDAAHLARSVGAATTISASRFLTPLSSSDSSKQSSCPTPTFHHAQLSDDPKFHLGSHIMSEHYNHSLRLQHGSPLRKPALWRCRISHSIFQKKGVRMCKLTPPGRERWSACPRLYSSSLVTRARVPAATQGTTSGGRKRRRPPRASITPTIASPAPFLARCRTRPRWSARSSSSSGRREAPRAAPAIG